MRSSKTSGVTLVEVIAGLTLMGSLLTVILVSSTQHLRQLKAAERKRTAVKLLDNFLASWSISDFSADGLRAAVDRTGMTVTGDFGEVPYVPIASHQGSSIGHGYSVQIEDRGAARFPKSAVVRCTVFAPHPEKGTIKAAWAEVIAGQ